MKGSNQFTIKYPRNYLWTSLNVFYSPANCEQPNVTNCYQLGLKGKRHLDFEIIMIKIIIIIIIDIYKAPLPKVWPRALYK